jgi:hypothetical protein
MVSKEHLSYSFLHTCTLLPLLLVTTTRTSFPLALLAARVTAAFFAPALVPFPQSGSTSIAQTIKKRMFKPPSER